MADTNLVSNKNTTAIMASLAQSEAAAGHENPPPLPPSPFPFSYFGETAAGRNEEALASALNHLGGRLLVRGEAETALEKFQESAVVLMDCIRQSGQEDEGCRHQFQERLRGAEAELRDLIWREEEQQGWAIPPKCLDMYPRDGTKRDESGAAFLPVSNPVDMLIGKMCCGSVLRTRKQETPMEASKVTEADADIDFVHRRLSAVAVFNMGLSNLRHKSGSAVKASKLFDMALSVVPPELNIDTPLTAKILIHSAIVLQGIGRLAEAEERLTSALSLYRRHVVDFGDGWADSPLRAEIESSSADAVSLLGRIRRQVGQHEETSELALQALELRRSVYGDDSPQAAVSMHNVGLVLWDLGRIDESIQYCARAASILQSHALEAPAVAASASGNKRRSSVVPGCVIHAAESYRLLWDVCVESGHMKEALEAQARAVELRRAAVLSSDSALLLIALADDLITAGGLLQDCGYLSEAALRYREALTVERTLAAAADSSANRGGAAAGQDTKGVAAVLYCMGQLCHDMGDMDAALNHYSEVLGIVRTLYHFDQGRPSSDGVEHITPILMAMGNLHLDRGETDEAVSRFAEAERIQRDEAEEATTQAAGEATIVEEGGVASYTTQHQGGSGAPIIIPDTLLMMGLQFHPHAPAA